MIFARCTSDAYRILDVARHVSAELHHNYLGTEHLLLALVTSDFGASSAVLADCGVTPMALRDQVSTELNPEADPLTESDANALATLGIDLEEVRRRIEDTFGPNVLDVPPCDQGTPITDKSKQALRRAVQHARRLRDRYVRPEHLLLALLDDEETLAVKLLRRLGTSPEVVRVQTLAAIHQHA